MMNKELLMSAVHNKMMDKALKIIAEEAFFTALPYPFKDLSTEDKFGLDSYVSKVIEKRGAKQILRDAVESFKGNPNERAKYLYMKSMYDICMEAATTTAKRVTEETDPTSDFSQAIQDANFTEEEYKKFEKSADSLELDEVGKIVAEKVVATIKSEQEAYENEQLIDQKIAELVEGETEEEKEKGVESFYRTALESTDPRHPISLLSKLVEVATESLATLYPEDIEKELSVRALNDLTFLFSLDSYRNELTATESMERLLTIDAAAVNENTIQQSAMECLQNPSAIKAGYVTGITAYTLMETLNTMNLQTLGKDEVNKFIQSKSNPSSYNNFAVESFIKKANTLFADVDKNIRTAKTVEALADLKDYYKGIKERVNTIGICTESFTECANSVEANCNTAIDKIDAKVAQITEEPPVLSRTDEVAKSQDIASINRIYSLYGNRPDISHFLAKYDEKNPRVITFRGCNDMNEELVSSDVLMTYELAPGTVEDYVADIINNSNFKKNGVPVKYHDVYGTSRLL